MSLFSPYPWNCSNSCPSSCSCLPNSGENCLLMDFVNIKYESFCLLCIIIQIWNRNNNLYKYKLDQAFVFSFLKNSILVQRKGLLRNQNICRLPVEIKAVKIKYASCQNENRNNCFSRSNLPVILITKIRIPAGMHTSMSVTEKATNIRILPTTCKLSLTPL